MSVFGGPNVTDSGLVLNLDAGNIKSYPGTGTIWYDKSGFQNNGTLTNGPTFSGGSIVFDGVDDYVDTTFKASTLIGNGNPFTLSAFFKTNKLGQQMLVACPDNPRFYIEVFNRSGILVSHWGIGNNNNSLTSTAVINLGQIYNYVAVYDGNTVTGYLNGTPTDTDIIGPQSYNTNFLQIGKYTSGVPLYFSGSMYTTQIYNRVLSAQEVLQNYNATKSRFNLT
jgi:hypothetical protein